MLQGGDDEPPDVSDTGVTADSGGENKATRHHQARKRRGSGEGQDLSAESASDGQGSEEQHEDAADGRGCIYPIGPKEGPVEAVKSVVHGAAYRWWRAIGQNAPPLQVLLASAVSCQLVLLKHSSSAPLLAQAVACQTTGHSACVGDTMCT